MDDAPRILGGRYEVGELIGRGGMAEVHIGHDTRLGRTVAIKILRSDLARDPTFQARFRREAQAAAALNHPAIVAVYDTGEDITVEPNGTVAHVPFIVMEYVEGHTVRDILRDGSAVPIEEAVEITAGVLSALEYSHHAGIVHRDIKPANVMLTPTGAVKVMDFGIARAMADAAGTMTQTQAVIGTAQYLSPEQARGEQVDSRSDLYSTGCLLFELLTGRPPFVGDSPVAVAYQHARETAQPPSAFASDVPESLDRITMKSLAKDRDQRYSTAAEFRSDLESAMRGGHINAPLLGALGAAGLGAAGAAAASGAPTQVMRPAEASAASTQLMGTTPAPAAVPTPVGAAGWAPLGLDDGGRGGAGGGAPAQYRRDVIEDEGPQRPWIMWVLIAIAAAAIIGIVLLLTRGGDDKAPATETVQLPDLVGMTEQEARDTLSGLDLQFVQATATSADVKKGLVISSDPAGPTDVPAGSAVKVTISQGPEALTIPVLKNQPEEQARTILEDAGFTLGNIRWNTVDDAQVVAGAVVSTDPIEGSPVAPDAQIVVNLSSGKVQLPKLDGMTDAEARAKLAELGLSVNPTEEDSSVTPGQVIRQDPGPGPVDQHITVSIVIARAPVIQTTEVPGDLIGKSYSAAAAKLGQAGLNAVAGDDVFDKTVPEGFVASTDPVSGTTVNEGSTVTIHLSKGPDPAAAP